MKICLNIMEILCFTKYPSKTDYTYLIVPYILKEAATMNVIQNITAQFFRMHCVLRKNIYIHFFCFGLQIFFLRKVTAAGSLSYRKINISCCMTRANHNLPQCCQHTCVMAIQQNIQMFVSAYWKAIFINMLKTVTKHTIKMVLLFNPEIYRIAKFYNYYHC
jgi:hypothetical protein